MQTGKVKPNSSNIEEFAFDGKDLYVMFKSGAPYRYLDVKPTDFQNMRSVKSAGSYLNQVIKTGYSTEQLDISQYQAATAALQILSVASTASKGIIKMVDFSSFRSAATVCF